jgi:hypothetical protein
VSASIMIEVVVCGAPSIGTKEAGVKLLDGGRQLLWMRPDA